MTNPRSISGAVQTCLYAALLGTLFFIANNIAIIAAILAPASGTIPQYFLRNTDTPEYLTGLQSSGSGLLLRNYFSPWRVPDAIYTPLLWSTGRLTAALPWSLAVRYHAAHLLLYIAASGALIVVFRHFLPTRNQRLAGAIVVLCSVPWLSIGYAITRILGRSPGFFSLGLFQSTYITADGLARGGTSNSLTLTFGTLTVLLAVYFLARRLETGDSKWIWRAAAVNFISALFHPFEFMPITLSGLVLLTLEARHQRRWRRAIQEGTILALPALVAILPYFLLLRRFEWLRDARTGLDMDFNPASVLLMFGLPAFMGVYLLLMRFRPQTRSDQVLIVWCLSCLALLAPKTLGPFHIVDGYVYVNAALVVRLLSTPKASAILVPHGKAALAAAVVVVSLCILAQTFTFIQLFRDGRSDSPELLLSAVVPRDEVAVREWLRKHAQPDDVVLAPGVAAAWMATLPIHTLAAHEYFSISFDKQYEQSGRFFSGRMTTPEADAFEREYGIRWVMVPPGSPAFRYFSGEQPVFSIGGTAVFERPDNQIRDYASVKSG